MPPLLAVELTGVAAAGSLAAGAAVGLLFWWTWSVLQSEDPQHGDHWRYDVNRIQELRRADPFYRSFQVLIQFFGRVNRVVFPDRLPAIQREILAAGLPRYWLPEEYLAKTQLIALLLTPVYVVVAWRWMGAAGIVLALAGTLLTVIVLRRRLTHQAHARLVAIKRRMPFLLDLMTLLMEAGATFLGALEQAVAEYRGHPLAQEFGRVLMDMRLGKTRIEAFEAMRDRLQDDEITSILGSMVQAENLGTPLSGVFRTQADVLRLKRYQRAEALAAEAGVKMLLPGVVVMAATVIIILGPFMMNFLVFGLDM
jgi:tight adherence protein C